MDPLGELVGLPAMRHRESLADSIYFVMRDAIASGILPAGFRLREVALSKHFGVSTTPVREALRLLEREGLVELSLHRGATVAQFHPERWVDLFEVREILAVHAVRQAALAAERDFTSVERVLAETEATLSASVSANFSSLDVAFHRALNDLGGNVELAELAEMLHWRTQGLRIRYSEHVHRPWSASHVEHLVIVAAVRDRDADRAETLMREHNAPIRDAVLRVLEQSPESI